MEGALDLIPGWQLVAFAAVFGAVWGSFANVVIVRWPEGMSVMRPASHCPACKTPIHFYDNIPVLSYLLLRGRCRSCKAPFSPRYAVVELALGLLSVAVLRMTLLADPPTFLFGVAEYFVWFVFVWTLVTIAMIDLETFLIPDVLTLPGIVVGVAANALVLKTGLIDYAVAAAGGYAVISLLFVRGYKLLTGTSGMGEGDPKLVAMCGAFLGLKGAVFVVFAGALQGLIIGSALVVYRKRTGSGPPPPLDDDELDDNGLEPEPDPRFRKARVPFGPFLVLGALEFYFFGDFLVDLYLGIVSRLMGIG